jgi:hypothetical protein
MCRNIRPLFNFDPPVTEEEIRAASLQYVRKISGFNKPSRANEVAFNAAVDDIARITGQLLSSLESNAVHIAEILFNRSSNFETRPWLA